MLLRGDPFGEVDRLSQQLVGAAGPPAVMAMDAWRAGETFVVELDLPGVDVNAIDLDVERNVLTVRAERPAREGTEEVLAAERPRGTFSRQLLLGDTLATEQVHASYQSGVLRLEIPVAEAAKPRKITVNAEQQAAAETADAQTATGSAPEHDAVTV